MTFRSQIQSSFLAIVALACNSASAVEGVAAEQGDPIDGADAKGDVLEKLSPIDAGAEFSRLAGNYGYQAAGEFGGQPYHEVGVFNIDTHGNLSAQHWVSFSPTVPLQSSCKLRLAPSGLVLADCVNVTLGNVPYTLVAVADAEYHEIRFQGGNAQLSGTGVAHRQLHSTYGLGDLAGRYGYSSRGTLGGSTYLETGTLTVNATGTITAKQSVSLFPGELTSTCSMTLGANGLGTADCVNETLGGAPYTLFFVVDNGTKEIHFFGLSDQLFGAGTANRI